ncbi:hypothetical protein [Sorangium sp. So ce1182]|uniref:hypothetical protein n=1 Tax=Sorangium sp. So ce1182 TaxID=3133334 RepID=UPI003F61A9F2
MISEGVFQRALEIALNAPERLTRVRRMNSGMAVIDGPRGRRVMRGAAAGTGDLVGYVAPDGLHLEIEAKAARGRPSSAQRRRAAALARAGAVYVLVHGPEREEELEAAVERAVDLVDAAIAARRQRP